jgi:molecular chaperone GrpE (heat shock protein)
MPMGRRLLPGRDVARQHDGAGGVDDARLKRLIQEAVDEALRSIAAAEGRVDALATDVARRTEGRSAEAGAEFSQIEGRVRHLEAQLRLVDDRHGKAEARIEDLAIHVGQRQPLDFAKVPPEILERSMQASLDELTGEIAKVRSADELERALEEALADVRGRSKGSELFERSGLTIQVRGLAAAVERRLLSAKAAQATYEEIVRHLRTHIPGYRPHGLVALVRARSADYAVEAAVHHRERIKDAEGRLETLLAETRRIEADARAADEKAAEAVAKSMAERGSAAGDLQARLKALEARAKEAEDGLARALSRVEAVERYAQKVESAMIRRTKEGTFKGDFTPVIDAVHEALKDGKARSVAEIAKRVKGVDGEVVEAVVREGDFEEMKGGKVRKAR